MGIAIYFNDVFRRLVALLVAIAALSVALAAVTLPTATGLTITGVLILASACAVLCGFSMLCRRPRVFLDCAALLVLAASCGTVLRSDVATAVSFPFVVEFAAALAGATYVLFVSAEAQSKTQPKRRAER